MSQNESNDWDDYTEEDMEEVNRVCEEAERNYIATIEGQGHIVTGK